jgi:osmotically-inducible protein OsmY
MGGNMPRSNRRQGRSFGRQSNPQQSYPSRGGGFEETGTGYRYDDEQRRFGQQSRGSGGRNWEQEQGRDPWERSRYSENQDYGSSYGQGSRFGRGGFEGFRNIGQQRWTSEGYPESYRGQEGRGWRQGERDWDEESRYGRGSEGYRFSSEDDESEGSYAGYEPSEYTSRRSEFGLQQRFGGYQGSRGQGQMHQYPGSSQSRWGTSRQSFVGRGPQGYKRSDERISEDINEMLTQDAEIDASNITVDVQNGEVTLRGSVPDREAKRRAEDLAESASGVKEVQNQLRVKREDQAETESKRDKGDDKQQRSHRQQIAS